MATPISGEAAQTAGNVADGDLFEGVDVSDTSMAPTGTNKKHTALVLKQYFQGGAGGGPMLMVAASNAPTAVKNRADYVCDGTDDDVQINAALALGSVQLTDGEYTIRAPLAITKPGVGLYGTGRGHDMGVNGGRLGGTKIKGHSNFAGEAFILVDQVGSYIVGMAQVGNLMCHGAGVVATVDGIKFKSFQGLIHDVFVDSMTGNGIHILGNVSPDPSWDSYDTAVYACMVARCGGAGLKCGTSAADIHVTECIFAHNTGAGVEYTSGSSGQFTQVHCYSNKNAIWYHGAGPGTRTKWANCKFEHSEQHGIFHDGSGGTGNASWCQYVNCGFNCNGESAHNTYDHVNVTGSSAATKLNFIGCMFGNSDGSANLARYCINLGTAGAGALIVGCYFGWPDGSLNNAGVATGTLNVGNSTIRNGLTVRGCAGIDDWSGTDGVPSLAAGAAAGTTPPGPVLSGNCTDSEGKITWGTGTGATAGAQVVVTYKRAKNPSGKKPIIAPANQATALLNPYVSSESDTGFTISLGNGPISSMPNTTYAVIYRV